MAINISFNSRLLTAFEETESLSFSQITKMSISQFSQDILKIKLMGSVVDLTCLITETMMKLDIKLSMLAMTRKLTSH